MERFFRFQRKYKIRCYLFSQSFDIDKKIRDLVDEMFLMQNVFRVFSYGKRILKKITLTQAQSDRPSTIAENLKFDSFLFFWCGSRFFTFIPKYSKWFTSFNPPELPRKEGLPLCIPKGLEKENSKDFLVRLSGLVSKLQGFFGSFLSHLRRR